MKKVEEQFSITPDHQEKYNNKKILEKKCEDETKTKKENKNKFPNWSAMQTDPLDHFEYPNNDEMNHHASIMNIYAALFPLRASYASHRGEEEETSARRCRTHRVTSNIKPKHFRPDAFPNVCIYDVV